MRMIFDFERYSNENLQKDQIIMGIRKQYHEKSNFGLEIKVKKKITMKNKEQG